MGQGFQYSSGRKGVRIAYQFLIQRKRKTSAWHGFLPSVTQRSETEFDNNTFHFWIRVAAAPSPFIRELCVGLITHPSTHSPAHTCFASQNTQVSNQSSFDAAYIQSCHTYVKHSDTCCKLHIGTLPVSARYMHLSELFYLHS